MTRAGAGGRIDRKVVTLVIDIGVLRAVRLDVDIGEGPVLARSSSAAVELHDAITGCGPGEIDEMDVGPPCYELKAWKLDSRKSSSVLM